MNQAEKLVKQYFSKESVMSTLRGHPKPLRKVPPLSEIPTMDFNKEEDVIEHLKRRASMLQRRGL